MPTYSESEISDKVKEAFFSYLTGNVSIMALFDNNPFRITEQAPEDLNLTDQKQFPRLTYTLELVPDFYADNVPIKYIATFNVEIWNSFSRAATDSIDSKADVLKSELRKDSYRTVVHEPGYTDLNAKVYSIHLEFNKTISVSI